MGECVEGMQRDEQEAAEVLQAGSGGPEGNVSGNAEEGGFEIFWK